MPGPVLSHGPAVEKHWCRILITATCSYHRFLPSKRKKSAEGAERKRLREDEPLDTGLSLQEDEDLAVHLLRNRR
jgi:hypothetical protein